MKQAFGWAFRSGLVISLIVDVAQGQTTVGPGDTYPVTVSTAENFELDGGTLAPTNVTLSGVIDLKSASSILRPRNPLIFDHRGNSFERSLGPTNFDGVIQGAGDLTLGNLSVDQLIINGVNTYAGHTTITGGSIVARTATAFGSAAGSTTIQGGNVRIDAATAERFRVEGGMLQIVAASSSPSDPITIAGGHVQLPNQSLHQVPIILEGTGGTFQFPYSGTTSWTGGSTGVGNLKLAGRMMVDAPLTHDGDVVLDGARLNVPNSYTGKTIIADDYVIDRDDVFGTSTTPIEIADASVQVQVLPKGNRGFVVKRGTLNVQTTTPIEAGITLGGTFEASIRGIGTFNGPIDYVTVVGGGDAYLAGGTFNGPIRGNTTLSLGGAEGVTLNAANEIQGLVHVTGGTVAVNHPEALILPATLIQGGLVEMNASAAALPMMSRYPYGSQQTGTFRTNVDQDFGGSSYLGEGTFQSGANVEFDRLLIRGTEVTSVNPGSITIEERLLALGSSRLKGTLKGNGEVQTAGTALDVSGNLSGYNGNYIAKNGTLSLGGATSTTLPFSINPNSEVHVYPRASVRFYSGDVILNDIYLHDTDGTSPFEGPLMSNASTDLTFAGKIDVGSVGSTIADGLTITGKLRGRNLKVDRGGLVIKSLQNELGGELRIANKGFVALEGGGKLFGLDSIRVQSGGVLIMRANDSGPVDRIDDSTAIYLDGGRIEHYNYQYPTGSETIGTLHLDSGYSEIVSRPESPLRIANFERERGSVLRLSLHAGPGGVQFVNPPERPHGMLGGWATTDTGFAVLDANNKFTTLQPTTASLNSAGPTDHVSAAGGQLLTADRVIASLNNPPQGNAYALDLGGHRLTVRSGGIRSSGNIINGELTAGDGQPAELILHNTSLVSANIVDNDSEGSVALVAAGEYNLTLSGANTYTGGTWVVGNSIPYYATRGRLTIANLAAIPENDRVHLDFGHYDLRLDQAGVVELAELHVRNGSYITASNATIDADVYYLEDGLVSAALTGDGTIYKDSRQTVEFGSSSTSPNFTGDVYLRDGRLRLGPETMPNAAIFVEGGGLEAGEEFSSFANDIVLDGGELVGRYEGHVDVASHSKLNHGNGYTLLYGKLSGDADLTIDGQDPDRYVGIFGDASQFTGDFHVRSGALRTGAPVQLGDGEVYVDGGAQLVLGSNRPSDGQTFVDRDVHLEGGSLYATPPSDTFVANVPNSIVTGDVYVRDFASIGANRNGKIANQTVPGLVLDGRVVLDDGAMIVGKTAYNAVYFGDEVPLIEVAGELEVGRDNVWRIELANVSLTGAIRARVPEASIDFQGVPSMLNLDQASIIAEAGRSLSITINGSAHDLQLASSNASLAGNGTLAGNFDLSNGATVAPGASPGLLTIVGDLEMGAGAIYEWEIDNLTGGAGIGWDLLDVEGALTFSATPNSPWTLELNEQHSGLLHGATEWLIASAATIDGFDPASVQVAMEASDVVRQPMASQFSIELRGDNLYLVRTVPEPASLPGIALLCLMISARFRVRLRWAAM